jgi:hypothetical protein
MMTAQIIIKIVNEEQKEMVRKSREKILPGRSRCKWEDNFKLSENYWAMEGLREVHLKNWYSVPNTTMLTE